MTPVQMITITKLLSQVDPVSMQESGAVWILDLGNGKAIHVGGLGGQCWYSNGKLHRTDGPALIGADGAQCWYQDNRMHRDDGPALIHADGTQGWYQHGKSMPAP